MPLTQREQVAARFGASAQTYDWHAQLQERVAQTLAERLPERVFTSILEVGCGTGLLTGHLLERFPDAEILAIDIAPEMVKACREKFPRDGGSRLRCELMDGEAVSSAQTFDLIVSSMTLQWFQDPLRSLALLGDSLQSGGCLHFATIGPDCFPEWRKALGELGVSAGLVEMPALPGLEHEERLGVDYGSGVDFLKALKAIGASTPREGYRSLSPGILRKALKSLDYDSGGRITWHIVYGRLEAGDAIAP